MSHPDPADPGSARGSAPPWQSGADQPPPPPDTQPLPPPPGQVPPGPMPGQVPPGHVPPGQVPGLMPPGQVPLGPMPGQIQPGPAPVSADPAPTLTAYPVAMEAPEVPPPGANVPHQPGGFHDQRHVPPFPAGAAPIPQPGHGWQPPPPVGPPARRGRGPLIGLIVMSVVAFLLFGVGGLLGYLWWSTASELDETRADLTAEVSELSDTVDARDDEIGRLGVELQETQDALTDAETALEGTENLVEQLEDDQGTIRECFLLIDEILVLEENGDAVPASLREDADETCADANSILGF